MRKFRTIQKFFLFLSILFLIISCNQTFQPLQENDKYHFSIYGYLDAAADTQWVRIGPAKLSINDIPDPTGIEVTLEHMESGHSALMNDSLFASKNFLNYWTTMNIENEQRYRITVERDGKSSHTTITTPEEIPPPIVLHADSFYDIYIDDSVGNLADLQVIWYGIIDPDGLRQKRTYVFPLRNKIDHSEIFGGSYHVTINIRNQTDVIEENSGDNVTLLHRQIFAAAAGPEWDESIPGIDDLEYFLDETASNVENGLGYVVGIDSKWLPLRSCLTSSGSAYIPCPEEDPYW